MSFEIRKINKNRIYGVLPGKKARSTMWNNAEDFGGALQGIRKVYRMLEDGESKDIYLMRLNWLVSEDKKYIDSIYPL